MSAPVENPSPMLSQVPDIRSGEREIQERNTGTTLVPGHSQTTTTLAKRTPVSEKGTFLQRALHFMKIISAVALLAVGIAALICLQFGVVVSTSSLILMIAILLVSFIVVIIAIQGSLPSQIARQMKQQVQQLGQENDRLHAEVDTLQQANVELSEQITQLQHLHTKLSDFGDKLETHTGDFRDLIVDFKNSLEGFKSIGDKIENFISPFEKLAKSLHDTFSKEGVQELVVSVGALRDSLGNFKGLIEENKLILAQMKEDAERRKTQIRFLESRKQELEQVCSTLTASIASLRTSTENLKNVEGRITNSIANDRGASPSSTTVSAETDLDVSGDLEDNSDQQEDESQL
ncbi:inclusion membrane protein [Chlamydia felis Fe/C-56]|uniref:Inclusion membrane protein n=1 Tax=Chlamydia felis (strain Fe/C-56) TaxID=264202 RepID=Q254Q8_CHLFF|nr:IncA family protein [Chlamydia felis]BAE81230.1 inclusion membrane protein [Chlamydia felis Fe/C-56]